MLFLLAISRLFYKGHVYDGYLYALVLQLIEDGSRCSSYWFDNTYYRRQVKQLESIHSYGILHNNIAQRNILFEPKSHHFFFAYFGLSEFVGTESLKLYKEEKR